jgi:hypothetical protein
MQNEKWGECKIVMLGFAFSIYSIPGLYDRLYL